MNIDQTYRCEIVLAATVANFHHHNIQDRSPVSRGIRAVFAREAQAIRREIRENV